MLDEADLVRFTAAGLYDPDSPTAGERLDLLRYLVEHGATFDDLVRFGREGRLPSLGGFLRRRRGRTLLTPRAVSEQGPFDLDAMARVWRASGFPAFDPDELLLTAEDVETFRAFVAGTELFGEDILLQFTRVLGAALASIADAAMATFGLNLAAALTESDASELEYARATAAATGVLLDGVPAAMTTLFFHHVEAAIQRFTLTQTGAGAEVAQLAVGFLDLEGSTTLMQELPAREAGVAISDFEARASALVAASGGRGVKTLGDEVMFVMTDEAKACEVALQLRDYVGTHAVLPALRGALATGELVRGYGDYYGPVVTLAARAAKCAAPGTVVVTAAVCERAGAARDHRRLYFTSTGAHDLRGFDDAVELFAVERA
jgi:adenylate cyclase